jgi:peptidoglycan/LPS O-acetylase OafA/YrhL
MIAASIPVAERLPDPVRSEVPQATGQLHYADFFRALAIFYVFFGHSVTLAFTPAFLHRVMVGDAVDLFDGVAMLFCLSGFLLSSSYLRAYLDDPSNFPLVRTYFWARFLRIYPLYAAAVVAITIYLFAIGGHPTSRDVWAHLFMLQNFSPATIQSLSGPLWTMPLDAQFYLVLPLGFFLLSRAKGSATQGHRINTLFGMLAILIVASCAYRFIAVQYWNPIGLDDQLYIVDQFPGMMGLFMLGIGARLFVTLIERGILRFTFDARTITMLLAGAVAFRVGQFLAHRSWLHFAATGGHLKAPLFASVDEILAGCGCVLLLVAASGTPTSWFGRFVAARWVAYAAAISYSFYLFHLTILTSIAAHLSGDGYKHFALLVGASLIILIPICFIAHAFVEKPFLERKARLRRSAI